MRVKTGYGYFDTNSIIKRQTVRHLPHKLAHQQIDIKADVTEVFLDSPWNDWHGIVERTTGATRSSVDSRQRTVPDGVAEHALNDARSDALLNLISP